MADKVVVGFAAAFFCSALSAGCDQPEFDSSSHVEGLRILGLSSSAQLVEPGEHITLDALWVDTRSDASSEVITAWFPGCINPEFDSLDGCQDELNDLGKASGQDWPARFSPSPGNRLELDVAPEILDGRKDFGIQYFFFAACRGNRFEYVPSKHSTVPIACRDASGDYVRQADFRLGFRTVTAIADAGKLSSANPVITGFNVDGQIFDAHCLNDQCVGFQQPACDVLSCPRLEAVGDSCETKESEVGAKSAVLTVHPTASKDEECKGGRFRVLVDETSAGVDWLLGDKDDLKSVEVIARYFVTQGKVYKKTDLLHARQPIGEPPVWDQESQSGLTHRGELFLWAVVYDSVGGVSWAGIGMETY